MVFFITEPFSAVPPDTPGAILELHRDAFGARRKLKLAQQMGVSNKLDTLAGRNAYPTLRAFRRYVSLRDPDTR
jgi:hypothetical protein